MNLPSVLSLKLSAIVTAAALAVGFFAGSFVTHAVDQVKYEKLVIKHDKAFAKAVAVARARELAQTAVDQKTAAKQNAAQTRVVTLTNTIIRKVPVYVTQKQDVACVSYGLVRVLDAAAIGTDPADLELPAGHVDDDCTTLKPSDLARSVASNYGVARQNAEQLNGLVADVRARIDSFNAP